MVPGITDSGIIMDWQTVFTVIGGGTIAFLAAWIFYVMNKQSTVTSDVWAAIDSIREAHAEYKLTVAKEFATVERVRDLESRLVSTLEGISAKMDKLIDAFNTHEKQHR